MLPFKGMRKSQLPLVPNHLCWLLSLHCKHDFRSHPELSVLTAHTLSPASENKPQLLIQIGSSALLLPNKAVWNQDQAGNFPWQVYFLKSLGSCVDALPKQTCVVIYKTQDCRRNCLNISQFKDSLTLLLLGLKKVVPNDMMFWMQVFCGTWEVTAEF